MLNRLIFIFLISFCLIQDSKAERAKIEAEVLSVNQEMGFFIISAGEAQGINIGDKVIVFSGKNEIGKGQIIEVRNEISAAEVIEPPDLIPKEGFRTEIYPFQKEEKQIEERPKLRPKWTPLFHKRREPEISQAVQLQERVSDLSNVEIKAELKAVFPTAIHILINNGYSITYSNRFAGVINATKGIGLSLPAELWADLIAAIDHKILLRLKIQEVGGVSNLSISANLAHTQKGKKIEGFIGRGSGFYREIVNMTEEIKKLAEAK